MNMNSKQTVSREEYRRLDNRVTCIFQLSWPASEIKLWIGMLQGKQQAVRTPFCADVIITPHSWLHLWDRSR